MNNTSQNIYDRLFVGGDLSGIQKFLYNITSKKASISLKGRSYFLQTYMENVCDGIINLQEVKGHYADKVYDSGGKFYLIVENSQEIVHAIETYAKRVKQELWREHQGQLSINISMVPFSFNADKSINANGMEHQSIGLLWKLTTEQFNRQKNQKHIDLIKGSYADFFEVTHIGKNPKVCAVTGIESDDCVSFKFDEGEKGIYVLPSVREQIVLGQEIRKVEHLRTFEEYAGDSYLGILRMDVDGLGKIFVNGFPSLGEYKAFSKKLDEFFRDELDVIRRGYADYVGIIYAGGDDLFAVGAWDKLIGFADDVRRRFADYVNNKEVTISGGIAIVHQKFPIAKAAEMAGEAEEKAKSYRNAEKNAFCLLGEPLSWKEEFDYVKNYKEKMVSLINESNMSRSILHKIMTYAEIVKKNERRKKEGKPEDFSFVWHTAYYLTRYMERCKDNPKVKDFCQHLRDKELNGDKERFRLMSIAARWAELTTRKKEI